MTAHTSERYETLGEAYRAHYVLFNIGAAYLILVLSLIYIFRDYFPQNGLQRSTYGIPSSKSNIKNEYTYSPDQKSGQKLEVMSLWIYPIKGCRGIELEKSKSVNTGLQYDRNLMFATPKPKSDEEWIFASQRGYPKMALIHTDINPEDNVLTVSYPAKVHAPSLVSLLTGSTSRNAFAAPLDVNLLTDDERKQYPIRKVNVWGQTVEAYDLSIHMPQEIRDSVFAGKSTVQDVRLFAVMDDKYRKVQVMAPPEEVLGRESILGFADFAPVNIVGLASVRAFNQLVKTDIPRLSVLRFRPNIIVKGSQAYDEESWKEIQIGNEKFHVIGRAPRCKVPNTDPDTGERHRNEPDMTIRKERDVDPGAPGKGCMGMHMVAFDREGQIKVGDEITVDARTEGHRWGKNYYDPK